MKSFELINTILYYDGPELVLLKDIFESKYIALRISEELKFVAIKVSSKIAFELFNGEIDLNHILINPEEKLYYYITQNDLGFQLDYTVNDTPIEHLPEEGYLIEYLPENQNFQSELLNYKGTPLSLSIHDKESSYSIDVVIFAQLITLFNNFYKHTFKKLKSRLSSTKKELYRESDDNLHAVAINQSSFKINFIASDTELSIFDSLSEKTLERIETLFLQFKDLESIDSEIINQQLYEIKGHALSNLKKLTYFLSEHELKLNVEKYNKNTKNISVTKLDINTSKFIYDYISKDRYLEEEEILITGKLDKVDATNKNWRIIDSNGNPVNGATELDLEGIIIGDKYQFKCLEEIKINEVTRKESYTFNLLSYKELDQ